MKRLTHEELIGEIVKNLDVTRIAFNTWKITSHISKSNGNIELFEISYEKEDEKGIFDGKFYNPQDFEDWSQDFFESEFARKQSPKALEMINEDMRYEMFENWCEELWNDETNNDNYEPKDKRFERLAKRLFGNLLNINREYYVWDPGEIEGLIYLSSDGFYYLLETDLEQDVFDSQSDGYWVWKDNYYGNGFYPDFCRNIKEFENAIKAAIIKKAEIKQLKDQVKKFKEQLKQYLIDNNYYSEQATSIILNDLDERWFEDHVNENLNDSAIMSIKDLYREVTRQGYERLSHLAEKRDDNIYERFVFKGWNLDDGNVLIKCGYVRIPKPYWSAHNACSHNKVVVGWSKMCGCFNCLKIYPSTDVVKWIEEDDGRFTAECPKCGTDSVIPSASGIPLNAEFLAAMKKWWF